jgi:excisionase family DNA binding protein
VTTWLRARMAAAYCGVSATTFRGWVELRKIPSYRVGKAVLFKASDLDAAIEKTQRKAI